MGTCLKGKTRKYCCKESAGMTPFPLKLFVLHEGNCHIAGLLYSVILNNIAAIQIL